MDIAPKKRIMYLKEKYISVFIVSASSHKMYIVLLKSIHVFKNKVSINIIQNI